MAQPVCAFPARSNYYIFSIICVALICCESSYFSVFNNKMFCCFISNYVCFFRQIVLHCFQDNQASFCSKVTNWGINKLEFRKSGGSFYFSDIFHICAMNNISCSKFKIYIISIFDEFFDFLSRHIFGKMTTYIRSEGEFSVTERTCSAPAA